MIDRVLTTEPNDLLGLAALEFDVAFVVDKSLRAMGVVKQTKVDKIFGFVNDAKTGAMLPATPAAKELWELGLSNEMKFFKNKKPETQLMIEALELGDYQRDPYQIFLSREENLEVEVRRKAWSPHSRPIIGVNTGCSGVIPYKKLTVTKHRELILELAKKNWGPVVLLGGPEDSERNLQIGMGLPVIQSPTRSGLRDGLVSTAACDIILTGDSLGMHMGIALEKWVVAWFGPTCAHEIDLFGRGVAVLTQASCAPCWKRQCDKPILCYDQVATQEFLRGIELGIDFIKANAKVAKWQTSLSKQPSLEMHSSPSLS